MTTEWLQAPCPYSGQAWDVPGPGWTPAALAAAAEQYAHQDAIVAHWQAAQRCLWCQRRLEGGQCPVRCRVVGSGHEPRSRETYACFDCGAATPDRYAIALEPRQPGDDRSTFRLSYVARCANCAAKRREVA